MNRRKKRAASNLGCSSCEVTFKIQLLPTDIIVDILSRLPIKTILCCKSVCKGWLRLISHPRFVELQLARSSAYILIETIRLKEKSGTVSFAYVEQLSRAPLCLDKFVLAPKCDLPSARFRLLNSCNGLLCFSGVGETDSIEVCNPISGEYVIIPRSSERSYWGSCIAFGFCSVTNRYKLLRIFYPNDFLSWDDYMDAEIYDMDRGTWRSIGRAPCAFVDLPFNSLLRGSLHWVRLYCDAAGDIYCFNFETEEFGSLPPPPCLDLDETRREDFDYYTLRLGVVEGCLFLCIFGDDRSQLDIWVMKDYGVKESWTKQFVIHNLYPSLYPKSNDIYEPIQFLNNGEILMLYNWEVVCYNTETKTFRGTGTTRDRSHMCSFIAYTPSFVSLDHYAAGVQRRTRHNSYGNN